MALSPLIRLARPRQWAKNAFVAAPLFFTPAAIDPFHVARAALAVVAFCFVSSAVYVLNDYCDRAADREHPEKRHRPLASGEVAPAAGLALGAILLLIAAVLSVAFMPGDFTLAALAYFGLNLLYSFWLKQIAILDVLLIAAGFVLRVVAGALAIGVFPTVWIIVCTGLLALFLALAKRRDDVVKMLSQSHRASLAGYNLRFIDASLAMVLGALLVSYVMYTTDAANIQRWGTDKLYLTTPFVAGGVLRYLQITLVEERAGSPTDIAFTDRFLILTLLGWAVTFAVLIYR